MIDDFFNMCHYWPLQVKRDSNQSNNMYKVLNSAKAKDYSTSFDLYKQQQGLRQSNVQQLLAMLQLKLEEKFYRMADAYKSFAG